MNKIYLFLSFIALFLFSCTPKEVKEHSLKIRNERASKNNEFLMDGSPFTEEDQSGFSGLKYFPIDYNYVVNGTLEPYSNPQIVQLEQGDTLKEMLRYGKTSFALFGNEYSLTIYKPVLDELNQEEDYLFVPFFDATNGTETYGGGRYIYPENQGLGTVVIDFNLASNPYCAYNHKYNCVVPPAENTIDIEIKAGEKSYH